tara:strand:+ start:546 stop:2078 length:1533 start_codon:yes stop_codon:yes gene_type:complete
MRLLKSKIVGILLLSLLFKPLWLFNNQNLGQPADDMYHWLHSATIAFDFDFDYKSDYEIENGTFNQETNVPSSVPGAGYLSAPFVFLFSLLDKLFINSENFSRTNPVGSFAYLGFFFAGVIYTYLGFYFLHKITKKYNQKSLNLILFCGLLSTLVHFVTTRFLMPHAIEFFIASCILYIFEKNNKKSLGNKEITSLAILYFALGITRPSTFLYSTILIFLYRKKIKINSKNIVNYIFSFGSVTAIYVLLSQILYKSNYMFLNTYGSDMDDYVSTFNSSQVIEGVTKIPNLFLSLNMGIVFSTPIIFFGVYYFFVRHLKSTENALNKIILLVFFAASASPLLIWQGREVAYGQRLLIGIIPMCILLTSKYLKESDLLKKLMIGLTSFNYLGYIFFYSSEKLTLREGVSLWGTKVGFTAENYYLEVLKSLVDLETILSAILRNIYVVDIFKFINLRRILDSSSLIESFNLEKIEKFINFTDIYFQTNTLYLLLVNLIIFGYSYFYIKLINEK